MLIHWLWHNKYGNNTDLVYIYGWWFGTWVYDFPYIYIHWEYHYPNWRTHIFQKGGSTTNQWIYVQW
jgi:hypothetical protein